MAPSIKKLKEYVPEPDCWIEARHRGPALRLTWLLLHTKITANQLTSVGILVSIIGGLVMSIGQWWSFILGGLLFILQSIIDCSDGIIARYRKATTFRGQYLEHFSHYITAVSLDMGLIVGVWQYSGVGYILLIGLPMIIFSAVIGYAASAYNLTLQGKGVTETTTDKEIKAFFGGTLRQMSILVFSSDHIAYYTIFASIITLITGINLLILLILIQLIGRFLKIFIVFFFYDKQSKMKDKKK